jgi:hypothetical protein
MKKNMGAADRIIRIIVAIVLAILIMFFTHTVTGTAGIVFIIIAAVFLATSFVGFCPLYTIFGIKTCKVHPSEHKQAS